ncbi:MAG: hypothetical protein Q8N03_05655 [Ignavibacteria bacterium]|jgi:hypothetical protein|nr:hypothetical protein [Ignavibacteria bacterium]
MIQKLFLFLIIATSIFAQGSSGVLDTIRVASLQEFSIPAKGGLVLTNARSVEFSAELLNESMQKIRDCRDESIVQVPSKEEFAKRVSAGGGRGATIQFIINESIESAGTFYIKVSFKVVGETGSSSREAFYQVIVTHPHFASTRFLRESYFINEKETFSFATLEYSDPTKYSYKVVETSGSVLASGEGSLVRFDEILADPQNVGKKLTLNGFYNGKPYEFIEPKSQAVQSSSWTFEIKKLEITKFSAWRSVDPKKEDNTEWLLSAYNSFDRQFLYLYFGVPERGQFVVATPRMSGLRLETEPQNLVTNVRDFPNGSFQTIGFDFNQDVLDQIEDCGQLDAKITVIFTSQFGERIRDVYRATIMK